MTDIDLLGFISADRQSEYAALLQNCNAELSFNGKPIRDVFFAAMSVAIADLFKSRRVPPEGTINPHLTAAYYHPDERVLYVSATYRINRGPDHVEYETVDVEQRIERRWPIGEIEITSVEPGSMADIYEYLDVLDLRRMADHPSAASKQPERQRAATDAKDHPSM